MARILVVDDEKSIRGTLRVFLTDAGHEVEAVEDAEQALGLLERDPFDILIADIVLPRMSGVELLAGARQRDSRMQVVMMTGDPTLETATEAVRAGAMDYLCKPVSRQSILRVVNHAIRLLAIDDERRRLEAENRRQCESLERRIAERTRELAEANSRLQRSLGDVNRIRIQTSAQERLSVLGQMALSLGDDFKGILDEVQGGLESLTEAVRIQDPTETNHAVRAISTATRRGRRVVWQMQEFFQAQEVVRPEWVNLATLLHEIADSLRSSEAAGTELPERHRLQVEVDEQLSVMVDPVILSKVVTALANNGLEAMPDGGELVLSGHKDGSHVVLEVADTGVGMTAEVEARCYEAFFTTKGMSRRGTGLTECRGLATLHGWTLQHAARDPRGTAFTLRLPQVDRPD